jgi:hypothetical protein
LRSETDHQHHVEEANHFNTFGRFYNLINLFSVSSSRRFIRDSRKSISTIYEHKQAKEVFECDEQTFEYHSNVNMPRASADTEVKTNHLNDRQNRDIESTGFLADSITCLSSETKISEQAEEQEVSSDDISLINFSPNHYRSVE